MQKASTFKAPSVMLTATGVPLASKAFAVKGDPWSGLPPTAGKKMSAMPKKAEAPSVLKKKAPSQVPLSAPPVTEPEPAHDNEVKDTIEDPPVEEHEPKSKDSGPSFPGKALPKAKPDGVPKKDQRDRRMRRSIGKGSEEKARSKSITDSEAENLGAQKEEDGARRRELEIETRVTGRKGRYFVEAVLSAANRGHERGRRCPYHSQQHPCYSQRRIAGLPEKLVYDEKHTFNTWQDVRELLIRTPYPEGSDPYLWARERMPWTGCCTNSRLHAIKWIPSPLW